MSGIVGCALTSHRALTKARGPRGANAPFLGKFAAISGVITLSLAVAAIRQKFPPVLAKKNIAAATEAFDIASNAKETIGAAICRRRRPRGPL